MKQLVEFRYNDDSGAELSLAAFALPPDDHKAVRGELSKLVDVDITFTFIDADSFQAKITGNYFDVDLAIKELEKSGWTWNE